MNRSKSVEAVLFAALMFSLLTACGPGYSGVQFDTPSEAAYAQTESEAEATPAPIKLDLTLDPATVLADWEDKDAATKWTKATIKALEDNGQALLGENPTDAKDFCPRYAKLDVNQRGEFWVKFISAMADRESSFREGLNYTEDFKDRTNTKVVSRGLLQISAESAKDYGCIIDSGRDLLVAEVNIRCGIKILNRWMINDKAIASGSTNAWKGGARYWSVLRRTSSRNIIKASLSDLPFCKNGD